MEWFEIIKKQRKTIIAPVDTMGCHIVPYTDNIYIKNFQILIKLILSPKTKDEIVHFSLSNLNNMLNPLSPENILNCEKEKLHDCIKTVGFHNAKLKNIILISEKIVKDEFSHDDKKHILNNYGKICELPGVGKKIAILYAQHALNQIFGISIDSHVHKIVNRIGIVVTKTPEQTRKKLETMFEKPEYKNVNQTLVGFGQVVCKTKNPDCKNCNVNSFCNYYNSF